jgi:DNA-binding GntR family transcriptional regulator
VVSDEGAAVTDRETHRILRPRSLTSLVVDQIRDLIITEHFPLGAPLSENTLAAMLGVSRAPVRDAFVRLQIEGMVDVQPQRGTFVFQYDATELREICELRQVLETGALRIASRRDRAELVRALNEQVRLIDVAGALDPRTYQPFDAAFHDALVRGSNNRELIDAYGRISGRIRAIRHRLTRRPEQVTASHLVHHAILDALADGRDEDAEAHLTEHVYTNYRRLLAGSGADESDVPVEEQ